MQQQFGYYTLQNNFEAIGIKVPKSTCWTIQKQIFKLKQFKYDAHEENRGFTETKEYFWPGIMKRGPSNIHVM